MPSPFQAAGAQADPSRSAPLHTNRFFTGLWTQRSPLRDAATPYLYEKFYSASRFDSLIGGVNTEITTRLTLARRPGHSVYNSNVLEYQRLADFRTFVNYAEIIHVMADCGPLGSADTYGAVRDVTGPSGNTLLLEKIAGSKTTFFQSVGNTLFMCDEAQTKKWVLSSIAWQPNTIVQAGTFIVDTNNNIQWTKNGGVTAAAQPVWATVAGTNSPADGSVTWTCKGSSVMSWGFPGPTAAPSTGQASVQLGGNAWAANTVYLAAGAVLDQATNTIQKLVTPGTTAATAPTFSATPGVKTTDGTAVWQCSGSADWQANAGRAVGDVIVATAIIPTLGVGGQQFFIVINPGISGTFAPVWPDVIGGTIQDGSVVWQAAGSLAYTNLSGVEESIRSTAVSTVTQITDSNSGMQQALGSGKTGAVQPTWNEMLGVATIDFSQVWRNVGLPPNITAPWVYGYAYRNSVTGHISTVSPRSAQIIPSSGYIVGITGLGSTDPQVDTIRIYRTAQGGSTLFFLADIPAPAPGASWAYYDDAADSALNELIQAQIAGTNNPPPANLSATCYHLGRLWGFANNVLHYSGGPDTLSGSGNEAWPPLNTFTLPSRGVRLFPASIGLLVFTQSDVYVVLGQGTSASPLYITSFQDGVGLLNYDSFAVNGSTAYLLTTANRCISFDPSAGETEVGFPIGDILTSYQAAGAHMAYHEGSSADTALYVADGTVGWYRMSTINAPESGQVWSPQAQVVGGAATLASIEVQPGVKKLLVAGAPLGPLLQRDDTVATDAGATFPANTIIGSIVLAQPGQIAGVHFLTTDSIATGTRPTLGLLIGELSGTFDTITRSHQDPTILPASKTIWGDRYYMSQNQTAAWCRHMQVKIAWPAEAAMNELLSYTIFGEIKNEKEDN